MNVQEHWYPVAFEQDLDPTGLKRIQLLGKGYVLFRGEDGDLACLEDRCPHRMARLSDGRWKDGQVECLYHGWTFTRKGACTSIPQLPTDASIPEKACAVPLPIDVVQGIVWIWPMAGGPPPQERPEAIEALDAAGNHAIDYYTELPYSQEALVENVLDFAHIHIAHDGVRGGGLRMNAGPLAFDIEDLGPQGFQAQFRSASRDAADGHERTLGALVTFGAPTLVHYVSTFADKSRHSGLALYCVPMDSDRCSLLYRAYGNAWPDRDRKRPRWREHLYQLDLLEQDMAVVRGQSEEMRRSSEPLKSTWFPIKSLDPLVLRYRKWIDAHSLEIPGAIGWERKGPAPAPQPVPTTDRHSLHTQHCVSCSDALNQAQRLLLASVAATAVLVLISRWLPPLLFLPLAAATLFAAYRSQRTVHALGGRALATPRPLT